jgi:hypothetical protein
MATQQLQMIVQMLRSSPDLAGLSVEEKRAAFDALPSPFQLAEDVRYRPVDAGGAPAEWITTLEAVDERVIYYLHGGGYIMGSINTHREMISRLSRAAGGRALAIDYRLAPENPFPAAVEGSTALTERVGDAKAREVLRAHERIVREALQSHGGSEVKAMGDGFMASFSSATGALECAIAMQKAFAAHSEAAAEPIRVRIGLNAGEPITEEKDLFGTAVNMAARIAAKAEGGEILASDVVRQLVAGKGFRFADRGEVALRGFEDPVRLHEVRWEEEG